MLAREETRELQAPTFTAYRLVYTDSSTKVQHSEDHACMDVVPAADVQYGYG